MPICDGINAIRKLKADLATSEVPIVALTASADPGEVREAFAAGCVGYLAKPMEVAGLVRQLDAWLPVSTRAAHRVAVSDRLALRPKSATIAQP